MLLEYVKAEYAVFCVFLKLMINIKFKQIHGNVFAQVIRDGITLNNHNITSPVLFNSFITFVKKNLVVCCGFDY